MTYQVLARKWRPKDFASLVGQDHVVRALTHALDQQRLHHAYLFTGTRGVGKTTLSRILAKALNCETGITSVPCGICRACREIDAGRFVDYVEMDAASNRGVDEMAALLERAIYAPVDARFKVYMIDEVHMLTNHAFNAMLKTLEEPPAHVKFILATTDPQKIPVTVLSRCLQFNLKQMPAADIVGHLDRVLQAEGIASEPQALRLLSRAADGSMRDALSLTDQAIAYAAGVVSEEAVRGMLGALDQHYLIRLLDGVMAGDGVGVLAVADEMASRSLSFSIALQDLAQLLNRIGWAQYAPASVLEEWPEAQEIRRLAQLLHAEQIQLLYQIATMGRSELGLAPDEYAGFTMTLLRMLAFRPVTSGSAMLRDTSGARTAGSVPIAEVGAAAEQSRPPVFTREPVVYSREPVAQPASMSSGSQAVSGNASVASAERMTPAADVAPAAPVAPLTLAADVAPAAPITSTAAVAPVAPTPSVGVARSSPARAALEALGNIGGSNRTASRAPLARTSMPVPARPTVTAAPSVSPSLSQPSMSAPSLRASSISVPAHAGAASIRGSDRASDGARSTPPDDEVPSWAAAPWDDDGAAAFLDSAQKQAPRASATQPTVQPAPPSMPPASVTVSAVIAEVPTGMRLSALGCDDEWSTFAASLDVKGLAQQVALQSELIEVTTTQLRLRIPVAQLASGAHVDKVVTAISERLGRSVALEIEVGAVRATAAAVDTARKAEAQRHAEAAIQNDPFIQALLRDFDASIMPGSTQAIAGQAATQMQPTGR